MVKLSKFYIVTACTALCLFGCGQEKDVKVKETAATVEAQESEEETKTPEEETAEEEPAAEQPTENVLHPVNAEGIDYLDAEGIALEAGTEISMVGTNSKNVFYATAKKGAQQAIADLNSALGYTGKDKITFSFAAPKSEDVIGQINIIDQILDKAPDAMCIAFTDATACKTQMQMAKNNGIQLIAFDTPDESRTAEALVATDNVAAAADSAAKFFNAVNYEGKIAVIVHSSKKQTGQDRYRGITNIYQEKYSNKNLRFVDVVYMLQDDRTEKEVFEELLEKNPDLSGIICTDLETTESAIDYVRSRKDLSLAVAGFDVSEKIVAAVKDGTIVGTTAQDPYSMGYAAIIAAARSIAGLENAESIHSEHLWIDASNLESEEAQSLLNY